MQKLIFIDSNTFFLKHKGDKELGGGTKFPSDESLTISLDTYENAFSEIRKVTGISDIGELVQRFKAVEDQNFSLFNYVNEVNNEIEMYAEDIVDIQKKIDGIKIESVKEEEERKRNMKGLETLLNSCDEKSHTYETQYKDISLILSDIKSGIESLIAAFKSAPKQRPSSAALKDSNENANTKASNPALSSDAPAPTEGGEVPTTGSTMHLNIGSAKKHERQRVHVEFALPSETIGSQGVSETNIVQFLGMIEQKSNELLTLNYVLNSPKKLAQLAAGLDGQEGGISILTGGVAGLLGQGPIAPIGNLSIVAPTTG